MGAKQPHGLFPYRFIFAIKEIMVKRGEGNPGQGHIPRRQDFPGFNPTDRRQDSGLGRHLHNHVYHSHKPGIDAQAHPEYSTTGSPIPGVQGNLDG